jgi:class 3 adenylate cyclase
MRCSKCGFDNPGGMKFCGQCTTPLTQACPNCHFKNPPGFKFCGQCTASLAPAEATVPAVHQSKVSPIRFVEKAAAESIEGERKTVTALFADIKGSTELMEHLDPEEVRAIVDPAFKLMIEAVRSYEGYVVESTGDGIFALFGAPLAHEDHPQRALYAALRLQEATRAYLAKLVADGGTPLEAQVGINTGEGGANADDHRWTYRVHPIGHTANFASRIRR